MKRTRYLLLLKAYKKIFSEDQNKFVSFPRKRKSNVPASIEIPRVDSRQKCRYTASRSFMAIIDAGHWGMTFFLFCVPVMYFFLFPHVAFAQGYDDPLTFQGVDHTVLQSAASRAAGGTAIGLQNDVGLMFINPAVLMSLKNVQVSIGGLEQHTNTNQAQHYSPLKYYSNFSLLMEGLTGGIPNPSDTIIVTNPNAGDTVQRPYDNIGPDWSHLKTKSLPVQIMIGIPFSIGEAKFVAGVGAVEYADLDHYYQNSNVLTPSIGNERPVPVALPASDSAPFRTNWSSFLRTRSGAIQGYGAALSLLLGGKISLGASGLLLSGSSDDYEQHLGRGTLTFYRSYFRLDSVYDHVTKTGTSDYSGTEITLSGIYRGKYVSVGISAKPPTTITRKFNSIIKTDTTGYSSSSAVSGEDKMQLPWRGTAGISLAIARDVTLGLEYELRSYASAVYTDASGNESNPWLTSSLFHVGAEYTPLPWLVLRVGVRQQAEVFEEAGNPLEGDPVSYSIYSLGCGVLYEGFHLNVTYEYSRMKYDDLWQTNVNLNSEIRNGLVADIAYEIPSLW